LTNPPKYDIIIRMRKLSLGIVCYATFSVVLILGACMKPVGLADFLNDERVQEIINEGKTGGKGGINYEHPEDLKPVLSKGSEKLDEGAVVTVLKKNLSGLPDSITITVSNAASVSYDSIEWYCNEDPLTTGVNENELTITADVAPFLVLEMYQLVVIGIVDGMPYSTGIFIEVNP
jgi:hypothetical protein